MEVYKSSRVSDEFLVDWWIGGLENGRDEKVSWSSRGDITLVLYRSGRKTKWPMAPMISSIRSVRSIRSILMDSLDS